MTDRLQIVQQGVFGGMIGSVLHQCIHGFSKDLGTAAELRFQVHKQLVDVYRCRILRVSKPEERAAGAQHRATVEGQSDGR